MHACTHTKATCQVSCMRLGKTISCWHVSSKQAVAVVILIEIRKIQSPPCHNKQQYGEIAAACTWQSPQVVYAIEKVKKTVWKWVKYELNCMRFAEVARQMAYFEPSSPHMWYWLFRVTWLLTAWECDAQKAQKIKKKKYFSTASAHYSTCSKGKLQHAASSTYFSCFFLFFTLPTPLIFKCVVCSVCLALHSQHFFSLSPLPFNNFIQFYCFSFKL